MFIEKTTYFIFLKSSLLNYIYNLTYLLLRFLFDFLIISSIIFIIMVIAIKTGIRIIAIIAIKDIITVITVIYHIVKLDFGIKVFYKFSFINFVRINYFKKIMQKRTLALYIIVDTYIAQIH